jgi:hypothetical protein
MANGKFQQPFSKSSLVGLFWNKSIKSARVWFIGSQTTLFSPRKLVLATAHWKCEVLFLEVGNAEKDTAIVLLK